MFESRKKTRTVKIGQYLIGGKNPIRIQSMTNTPTKNIKATLEQIDRLAENGCEIVRVAVPDMETGKKLPELNRQSPLPLVADIHFDYRLALMALDAGFTTLRINPGNILKKNEQGILDTKPIDVLAQQILACDASVRVGVNSGSVEKDLLDKYGHPSPEALVESALRHTAYLEERGVTQIKVSIKSSSVIDTIKANMLLSEKTDYPIHLGVTEAGTPIRGSVKSALGIGSLLLQGIGDTIRVSLTANPVEELAVAKEILRSSGARKIGAELISCPTCGRTEIDLIALAEKIEEKLIELPDNLKVAVMGCVVNGPGEAKEADIGLAGGRGKGVIFKKGTVIHSVQGEENLLQTFMAELDKLKKI